MVNKILVWFLILFIYFPQVLQAQPHSLPDPLVLKNGRRVTSVTQWRTQRRPELLALFASQLYGQSPSKPAQMRFEVFDSAPKALGGKATRKQVAVWFNGKPDGPRMDVLLYIPNGVKGPVPAIVGLNFWGNSTIQADPAIRISTSWMESNRGNPYIDVSCVVNHQSTDACRGLNARQWPVDSILSRGYALVTAYREDIASDEATRKFSTGVHPLYPDLQNRGDNFGTVAAWAWGLSRIMDYLQTDKAIDAKRVAVFGWSRLGKAALWAGATDERFAMVISNESGAGGAKLFHRGVGENIRRLCTVFPHWFAANFRNYMDQDTLLPFDQHLVISLMAPRPVYIASAEQDKNSDPEGEFESAKAASSVYQFLGTDGLPTTQRPPLNQSVQGQIGYHIRTGGHDVTGYDWAQYLRFMDKHFKK
ncbi:MULTISPECIES: acetylxylan esterase [unclassified Spirosoma]|uniref:alpha/beta hydrolase family protein n=1 Tax=unclassified Spirosoma TaxID=2621999 RepID=UPI00095B90BF|nr:MULTISPECIES: acetylxylan esterase [unclassified Spirosoma]MBN8821910.1 acetylxylan esterase [Spirosoma sp.]OJW80607.1 MAG: acetylxylan esterase [Spirosoma sp. 48-14]